MSAEAAADAVARLDALTRRLRRECPWDREQDERSIVPHTVEEAYELAAAAHAGDDAKLLDELGDVLFQVHFLSLLLEERGAGSLAEVAEHVPPEADPPPPARVRRGAAEGDTELARARSCQLGRDQAHRGRPRAGASSARCRRTCRARCTRARCSGARPPAASTSTDVPYDAIRGELDELEAADGREERFHEVGDVLFAAVNVARKLRVDPELALRAAAERFRGRVEGAADLAARDGADWHDLSPDAQLGYYARVRLAEASPGTDTDTD